MSSPQIHVKSTQRVFPLTPLQAPVTTKLSIADATTVRFAPCSALWLFDKPSVQCATLFTSLEQTLKSTLDEYRHFAGYVHWASEDLVKDDLNKRTLGRPAVTYSTSEDPGVELVIAECDRELAAIVPSWSQRSATQKVWNATDFPQHDFLPATPLALSALVAIKERACVLVQLTAFKCGGFAVGVKITHCLSDAVTLLHFVHSWAARSRSFLKGDPASEMVQPVFDPALIDRAAALREDGSLDPSKISKARALPMHRFDWWADDAPGYPDWAMASSKGTMPLPDELGQTQLSPSAHPPWPSWDTTAPVEHVQIRFAAEELARMKKAAQTDLPEQLKGLIVSRLDAALAHVWILINRARQHHNNQDLVYLNVTLGLRSRVSIQVPDSFVGSPLAIAHVCKTAAKASTSLGSVAASIRQTMSLFTPDAVSAHLHDAAHEVSPQRLWQGFLGRQHTLVTSWTRAKAYEVDFVGQGELARYVQGVMPRMDGLVQVIDVGETGDFDVSVCLEKETMERFVNDPLLKAFEK